jgi:fructosamine-3-kinase
MNKELLTLLEHELQVKITQAEQVHGGDINQTFILHSPKGNLFLKLNNKDRADMFEKEYKGLEISGNTKAIAVPRPLITGTYGNDIYLVMECIEKGKASADFWQVFGRQLAALHKNSNEHFGLDHDNYIGSLPQKNDRRDSWSTFYAEQRILFLVRKAFDEKKCGIDDTRITERLCSKLGSLFPAEQPALLHGDLWSGNYMTGHTGMPVIYDPAVYYGHREMDIGMSLLFGGFDSSFYDHYNEFWPMEKNWRQRVDLTQLYPLLVHLILFGGHYYHSVRDILKKYG